MNKTLIEKKSLPLFTNYTSRSGGAHGNSKDSKKLNQLVNKHTFWNSWRKITFIEKQFIEVSLLVFKFQFLDYKAYKDFVIDVDMPLEWWCKTQNH